MTTVHDFTLPTLKGEPKALRDYAGHVLLLVNVASKCGLTPQYEGLEALQRRYAGRGFSVLGFPCNQFMGQEPGTPEEIESFCKTTYDVTFPLFAKLDVNGPGRAPLYAHLVASDVGPEPAGDIAWNFGKFLVGRDGTILARFSPKVRPDDAALVAALEKALG
ncbi:MAG: glutathione peroxidase [Polyangiales bacterium]